MTQSLNARALKGISAEKVQLLRALLKAQAGRAKDIPPIVRAMSEEAFRVPATAAQRGLWFVERLQGEGSAYHIHLALRLIGDLNEHALRRALQALVQRHEILRVRFVEAYGELWQEIRSVGHCPLRVIDESASTEEHSARFAAHIKEESIERFDLATGPLARARLIKLAPAEHLFIATMHHIVSDGWSFGVLTRELAELYSAWVQERSPALPELAIQFADYAQWQSQSDTQALQSQQLAYWIEQLRGAPQVLTLPSDRPRPATQSHRGGAVGVELSLELTERLRRLAKSHRVTLAMALQTAWSILLARVSGQSDVVVGMPVANRERLELNALIGLFVNTLALRVRFEDDPTVEQLLVRVREVMQGAYTHQDVSLRQVVEVVQPVRSLGHSPIFQVTFAFQAAASAGALFAGLQCLEMDVPPQAAQFDLTLSLRETDRGIRGYLNYASDLFDEPTVRRWVANFECLLRSMVAAPDLKVSRLALMDDEERTHILQTLSAPSVSAVPERSFASLVEAQAQRTPQRTALVFGADELSFAQLDARANQLARYLIEHGAGPGRIIGLCMERGLDLIVAIVAVLKAGAAYVPLDPDYPTERLRFMLEDAAPVAVLTHAHLQAALPSTSARLVSLDSQWQEIGLRSDAPLRLSVPCDALAYIIYTSGSTGRPKGVMVDHAAVVNLWLGLEELYEQSPACERVALNASVNFDASVQQLVQLLSGRTLVVVPQEIRRDGALLLQFLRQQRIDAIDCTPSQLKSWLAAGLLRASENVLRLVLVGGEAIDAQLWSALASCATTRFFNVYGPTECTVDTTAALLNADATAPHIGRPMTNRRVYILDAQGAPVPIGVAGEIWIGGQGVARGYLNRPELTAERFRTDPFANESSARMYKTGDLGRWRANGTITYLGRNDDQVKLRGYRIELGEIEAQLARMPGIAQAAVLLRESAAGEASLVAYVVLHSSALESAALTAEQMRAHLLTSLPEPMVPVAFVVLKTLPLTPSGKLDHRALPAPALQAFANRAYERPQGEVEPTLSSIWQELLGVERVGRNDNFFELGGHSLKAVRVIDTLAATLGVRLSVADIFKHPTIEQLGRAIERSRRVAEPVAQACEVFEEGVL